MLTYPINSDGHNWLIEDDNFSDGQIGRIEALFHLANGYMGVRASTEEPRMDGMRGIYVAGTFNKFSPGDVTELPNLPDMLNIEIKINGGKLMLGGYHQPKQQIWLDMKTALVQRSVQVETAQGIHLHLVYSRIVSMASKHILAQKLDIQSSHDVTMEIKSGIDGRTTNTGVQHFFSGGKMLLEGQVLRGEYHTNQSGIDFCLLSGHRFLCQGRPQIVEGAVEMGSRTLHMNYSLKLEEGKLYSIEKISGVYTSIDKEQSGREFSAYVKQAISEHANSLRQGFDELCHQSAEVLETMWKRHDIRLETGDAFDQVSIRYAILQTIMMTPAHDNRMNIGAKGLSGEAYKGHTFWDTEVFLLPMWAATNAKVARSLLEYRYLSLEGARRKAAENGYEGAMFPWESAWVTSGEVTPRFGAADIVTGKPMPIICGDIEQHITADVAYGVWFYNQMSGDENFMEEAGYQLVFETAGFWQSRWEWEEEKNRYVIRDVIGPDEYSEHVNNNAFTNIISWWNVKLAIEYYDKLQKENHALIEKLAQKIPLEHYYSQWIEKVDKIYRPMPDETGLIPQDDDYLTLQEIPIEKYKNSPTRADIIKDYNMGQLENLQVSKQADIIVLMNLGILFFTPQQWRRNFEYYEKHCLHDSSLSLAMYSIAASHVGESALALSFFNKAQKVDLNNSDSAKEGIHAASMGGLWQCVVNGFAGLTLEDGRLRVEPCMPQGWHKISFAIWLKGIKLEVVVTHGGFSITPGSLASSLEVIYKQKVYTLAEKLEINF